MAVELQSLLRITALTRPVTYATPRWIGSGGCSLTAPDGTTHETAGSVPAFAAAGCSFFSALMTTRVFAGLASPLPLRYSAIVMCSIFLFGAVTAYFAPETKGIPLRD